jgi:hypothetical protein
MSSGWRETTNRVILLPDVGGLQIAVVAADRIVPRSLKAENPCSGGPRQEAVRFSAFDRLMFVGLYRRFPDVRDALAVVRPETVIRWRRAGFRTY